MDVFDCRPIPHVRRNRHRERPGSRTRRTRYRKEGVFVDFAEDIDIAHGSSRLPPFDYTNPSPLRRQTFDQSWQRWKAREAEENANSFSEKNQHEILTEQRRIFGGEVDDDKLRNMGLLYDGGEDSVSDAAVAQDVPFQSCEFYLRTNSRGRSRCLSARPELPLFLSTSFLSNDEDIMRLMAAQTASISTHSIQHRNNSPFPQSLPLSVKELVAPHSSPLLFPLAGDDEELAEEAWDIISNLPSTPLSELETWVHLGDDL